VETIQELIEKLRRPLRTPGQDTFSHIIHSLSARERFVLSIFVLIFVVSGIALLWNVQRTFLIEVPAPGGSIAEGVIGSPRFISPLLAISDTDRDMTTLVYSGLLRASGAGLEPDLAESFSISEDGLEYFFTLRENLKWHDGEPVTVDDVIFTIEKAQDSALRSPKRAVWEGVEVEKLDDRTLVFLLSQPYAPFLENTTMGIMPKHIWEHVEVDQFGVSTFNTEPVGTGPYKVVNIKRDRGGIPEYYDLQAFKDFALGAPFIPELRIRFYSNQEKLLKALDSGSVTGVNSLSPEIAVGLKEDGYRVENSPLPRVFGVFFNQDEAEVFTDILVRKALSISAPKELIVERVLSTFGTVVDSPIPPGILGFVPAESTELSAEERMESATEILGRAGFEIDEETGKLVDDDGQTLSFSLSTSDVPELKATAQTLKEAWESLGMEVTLKIFESGNLSHTVIRPRDYDALLFGEIIGRDSDPFAFWHSSQRLDPGLNIALYANISVDGLLEDARATTDTTIRVEKYLTFQEEVAGDIPAVFLYAPDFIYVIPDKVRGVDITSVTIPSERFLNIYEWFIDTDRVWKFLQTRNY